MALPILDGNQTATTLSTVVSAGAHIPAHTVVSLGSQAITDMRSAVSGSVVSISNFPSTQTIAGTVTANVPLISQTVGNADPVSITGIPVIPRFVVGVGAGGTETSLPIDFIGGNDITFLRNVLYKTNIDGESAAIVGDGHPLPISGTVTANAFVQSGFGLGEDIAAGMTEAGGIPISGTVTVGNSVTIGSLPNISGTVTANNPSGALTTRFGSVTTANTAQITSAVTNTSRKYLLAQNISAGTVTIGIGFSPTTTQGIQLSAGGGISFDSFCPTGAVWWLGATTGATFTILEG